ncbi:hypothetical protein EMIHUDRAFT_435586 [Emiliania huxleyi CCMP1516]|uniref:Glycosyltransferase 2-like domain-containing protein n=2 Tax=Emiliania huxleyi TaxID=2903 RepID=A0A0D3JF92_EMIH1|nr:hypothetical protein EMIHUDRAFT_435586 [Emiliania huxleyi CCMP1516]EOD22177.1 hypothetical protein EMIHUDRAFT_435586 [Emiliania huxleyi CCMP1516]|eukprot:XP_005774606.1 hypothetical protein EMIHUDRAFT_435586 [Emiliania huxleyi CCMP1516]
MAPPAAEAVASVVFTATWYSGADDVRCLAATETLRALVAAGLPVVVVDASPAAAVRDLLSATGAIVSEQKAVGKKGAALREAVAIASALPGVVAETWLCWQEPEKTDMARHWATALDAAKDADVLVPRRESAKFAATYPIEQVHSETYGNLYLDAVARTHCDALPSLDWHFGPFAFRARHSDLWTRFGGPMYDAQVVPLVHAVRKGLRLASVAVAFEAPAAMKAQEEGDVGFIEKRLAQLNSLDPLVKAAWTDSPYC